MRASSSSSLDQRGPFGRELLAHFLVVNARLRVIDGGLADIALDPTVEAGEQVRDLATRIKGDHFKQVNDRYGH